MNFLTKDWWNAFLKKLEKRLAARAKIIGTERQSVSLTRDGTWRDLDLSSETSSTARWAYISLYWTGSSTYSCQVQWRKKGRSTTDIYTYFVEVGDGSKAAGFQFWIELDDDQTCQYNGASASGTLNAYVIGYIESGRQWI